MNFTIEDIRKLRKKDRMPYQGVHKPTINSAGPEDVAARKKARIEELKRSIERARNTIEAAEAEIAEWEAL